ncbi:MAG: LamG-like jellyroll fold domain-containing protein [Planctomycetota bacterium]|jgi:hypothetical protein
MKKIIPLLSCTAGTLVLFLALGLTVEIANADFTFSETMVESEPLRVLFIGNSLTAQIRTALDSLIQASPYSESTFEYVALDYWHLQQHVNSENTMSKIRNSDWDFVVLQEQSNKPTLPDRCAEFYDAVAKLSEAIKESGAQVVLYMTWGYRDGGNHQINPDYETMQQNLIEAYTEAARQVDAIIAPVGVAWRHVYRDKPDLSRQLYKVDGLHPSYKGAFLTACVFYATLFDADPTELAFNGVLPAQEAAYLRREAKEAFIPIVDFNGDGIVDAADICIMVDHWGTDEPLCDVGPMPWGDGIVDVQDLIVLAEHLFEEVNDPTLIAHWPLDETEGILATNSLGVNDAVVIGGVEWQPAGGQIDGALKLDGVSGYALTGAVLNPADGPFSIIAWTKGDAPGQVIVSQQATSDWLALDAEGKLMTELKSSDPLAVPLFSEAVITDGQWHRIGLVWDGSTRTLYVDGVVVAEDSQPGLEGSQMGLYIGTGKSIESGTLFSGLIDDVRIYNRVVNP